MCSARNHAASGAEQINRSVIPSSFFDIGTLLLAFLHHNAFQFSNLGADEKTGKSFDLLPKLLATRPFHLGSCRAHKRLVSDCVLC